MEYIMAVIKYLDWRRIRHIGELQVLTRASYIFLVLVPILAALWPGIRLMINQYNQSLWVTATQMEITSQKLKKEATQLQGLLDSADSQPKDPEAVVQIEQRVEGAINNLEAKLGQLKTEVPEHTIEEIKFPLVWGVVFFAALAVMFAHLIYQIAAPKIVRKNSLDQYSSYKKNEYAKDQSQLALKIAEHYIDRAENEDLPVKPIKKPDNEEDPDEMAAYRIDTIDRGAVAEYLLSATGKRGVIWTSAVLYLIGGGFIFYIIYVQSRSVLEAAGGGEILKGPAWAALLLSAVSLFIVIIITQYERIHPSDDELHGGVAMYEPLRSDLTLVIEKEE